MILSYRILLSIIGAILLIVPEGLKTIGKKDIKSETVYILASAGIIVLTIIPFLDEINGKH